MTNLCLLTPTSWADSITATTTGTIWSIQCLSACSIWLLQDLYTAGEGPGLVRRLALAIPTSASVAENGYKPCKKKTNTTTYLQTAQCSQERCHNVVLFWWYRCFTCWLIHSSWFSLAGSSISSTWLYLHHRVSDQKVNVDIFTYKVF